MAVEKKLTLEEGYLTFAFVNGNDLYAVAVNMAPYAGKLPDDLSEAEKQDFLQDVLFDYLVKKREIEEDEPQPQLKTE